MEKRIFVTSVITNSMMEKVRSMDVVINVESVDEGIDGLKNVEFISALKDEALINALREKGIYAEINPIKISLLPGDTVYVIDPGIKLYNLYDSELPKYSTITITKYEIITKSEFIKKYVPDTIKK